MRSIERADATPVLDDDALGALRRLDDDLRTVEAATTRGGNQRLDVLAVRRRRAVAAYEDALSAAPGIENDERWYALAEAVATFVAAAAPAMPLPAGARAALVRLRRLVIENGAR